MDRDRREFLRQVTAWTAGGAAAAIPVFRARRSLAAAPNPSQLSVGKATDYRALVGRVLEPLGGMPAFVKKGDRVVVKPNIGWNRTPAQGANTHPEVVAALVQQALLAGAARVQVFDRTCHDESKCYRRSGIRAALAKLEDSRVGLSYVDELRFVPVKIARGESLDEWEFYRDALKADVYLNVPVAKHHSLAGLTLGLKNVMGVIGGLRGRLHLGLAQKLADLNTVVRPQLTVVDATRILLRGGPAGGDLDDVKTLHTLLASADPVAADAYATTLFGQKPSAVESTVAAQAAGLGEMDIAKVKITRV